MTGMIAMVQLYATRARPEMQSSPASHLSGLRALTVISHVTEDAAREGCDESLLRTPVEDALRQAGLVVNEGEPASLTINVDALDLSGPVATSRLQMAVDLFEHGLVMREHDVAIAWKGYELGTGKGNTFASSASAALTILLERFASDFRAANSERSSR